MSSRSRLCRRFGFMLASLFALLCAACGPASAAHAPVKLFGTIEFKRQTSSLQTWLNMLQRHQKSPLFIADDVLNPRSTWFQLRDKTKGLPPMEQLKAVNRFWNLHPYIVDPKAYGKPDYWASPREFNERSGDCEDYAIAKYFTLKALGVPVEDMRIVVVKETIRNIAHAVLVVFINGDAVVLDNLSNAVLSHTKYRNYDPQFSVNEEFRWAHLRPKKKK